MTACTYLLATALLGLTCWAQGPQPRIVVTLDPIDRITVKAGQSVTVPVRAKIDSGFHVNSDKPNDPFLIPLKLTWNAGPLEKPAIVFPKPETAKLPFSEKPVSIFSGQFEIATNFTVAPKSAAGPATVVGKLRYQACNDHECLIPRTLDVNVPVEIIP